MTVAVVIPVHNDAGGICRCVEVLQPQLQPDDQLVVVDDGSTTETTQVVHRAVSSVGARGAVVERPHEGRAAARNAGWRAARTDVVLFLGSDTIPERTLLTRHRVVHRWYPEETSGCLGFVTWDPALSPSPFMVWLEHGGPQNAYGELAGSPWIDPQAFCYASNLSLKRAVLERVGGFDAKHFPGYGWEDTDLGIRLSRAGCTLFYEPSARAWHAHAYTVTEFLERQRAAGRSVLRLAQLHPQAVAPPAAARRSYQWSRRLIYPSLVRKIATSFSVGAERRWVLSGLYARVTGWAFTDGVQEALGNRSTKCGAPRAHARGTKMSGDTRRSQPHSAPPELRGAPTPPSPTERPGPSAKAGG